MRKVLLAVIAALGLLIGAAPAYGAPPPDSVATASFVIQTGTYPEVTQADEVAALWAKNTGISVAAGDCVSSPGCISVKVVDVACGMTLAGCAYTGDQWCVVEITRYSLELESREFNVLGHEVGHCILGTGYHNLTEERSIMYPTVGAYDSKKRLTRQDRLAVERRF